MEASAAPIPVRLATPTSNGSALVSKEPPAAERVAEPVAAAHDSFELPPAHRVSGTTLAALAAVTGLAAIALGMWAFVASVRDGDTVQIVRPAPVYGAAQAISLLSKPSTQRIPLRSSAGALTLAVSGGGRGVLVVDGLALAPVGLTYQAWVVDPAQRPLEHLPAATFSGVETVVPLTARIPPGWVVGVTVEKSGGADEPSRAFRFGAQRPR